MIDFTDGARVIVYPSGTAQAVFGGMWTAFGSIEDAIDYLEDMGYRRLG